MKKVAPDTGAVDTRPLLTLDDVAARTKHSKRTVQRWIDEGKLRAMYFGRSVRIHEDDYRAFVKERRV